MPADRDVFDNHLAGWDDYLATPWARVRYDVVGRVLDQTLSALGPGPLQVLDLGGGDGVDSVRLAAAGHQVTVVDQAPGMLERARTSAEAAGSGDRLRTIEAQLTGWRPDRAYDLVLCHFVLQYLDVAAERQVWRLLRAALRAGGVASVVCPNPVADVLGAVRREGDPGLALRRLDGEPTRSVTFDQQMRPTPRTEAEAAATVAGFRVVRRVGLRVAVDLLPDGPAKSDPAAYPAILALEHALAEREPYVDVARAWQLVVW